MEPTFPGSVDPARHLQAQSGGIMPQPVGQSTAAAPPVNAGLPPTALPNGRVAAGPFDVEDPGAHRHPRTDLAVEAHAAVAEALGGQVPGVSAQEEQRGNVHISRVHIFSRQGEEALGKVSGRYVTLDAPALRRRNREVQAEIAEVLTDELARLMNLGPDDQVLVVGLGNWNATPDALGPKVVASLLVTRHLRRYLPAELVGHLRGVAAVAPGVLGLTGIETGDIVRGIVSQVQPAAVICIDALAAGNLERVNTSIQLSDTGINPGSGVGNKRAGITEASLGVPVFAIGVPTVVHATTIVNDALDLVVNEVRQEQQPSPLGGLAATDDADRQALVEQVLQPDLGDLIVTPKEVDVMITDLSRILAGAMNAALHPGVSKEEMDQYLN